MSQRPWSAELADNTLRYRAPQPGEPVAGHVESYFLRANDPERPRALWVKATVLAPLAGEPVAETWFIWFDGERGRTFAHRETTTFHQASFHAAGKESLQIDLGAASMRVGAEGKSRGNMRRNDDEAAWDFSWTATDSSVGDRLSIFPWKLLRLGPFPKSKLLTPFPSLRFTGSVDVLGEHVSIDGWTGMQGHNWGKEHAFEYAWGQCLFPAEHGRPEAMVEGFTGRVKIGDRTTPRMSAMVVRKGSTTYRFDRIFDFWRQQATLDRRRWTLHLEGPDGKASLTMDAGDQPLACLGYRNPDGHLSYCFNTKLARVWLQVSPTNGASFSLESAHGGALEFLRHEPDSLCPEVI
jgi:hypothetical protein